MNAPIQPVAPAAASRPSGLLARLLPHASVVLGVLAIVLIWVGASANIAREKAAAQQSALQDAGNLTRAFEEHIVRSLQAADQALLYFRDSYERNKGQIDVALWARPYRSLADFVLQVAVIDRNGLLAASSIESAELVDLGDREHFEIHRWQDTDTLFISTPVVGRVSGRQSIQLARRISAADGSFGGVMVLSIDPRYFSRFYETINVGEKGSISLIGTDGVLRAQGARERRPIGASLAGGRIMSEFARAKSGSFRAVSRADGVERFVTYRAVKGYPLIVSVDLATDDIFAFYYTTRTVRLVAAGFLTVLLLPLIILVIAYQRGLARARDAAEAGTRARAQFLAVMSHEIRTPLNAVLGFAGSLLESRLDDEQRRTATALLDSGDSLLRILNDVLDFSRLDAGRIQFEAIPFSPAAVVDATVSIVGPGARAKGLALRVDLDPDLPPALVGDAGRLRQVLLNLAGNAIKFTTRGEVRIAARCLARTDGKATVQWSVADTGIGIAPDRIGEVFADFVQADSSVSRRFGGSGLGLAICKRIMDQMDGEIGVASELDRGSVFTFSATLPLAALPAEAGGASTSAGDLKDHIARLGRPLRILMAEDNPTNQLVGRQMLRDLDAAIGVASNGAEAVQLAGCFPYDIILMDMQMPEMSGIQATRAIRASTGANAHTPIVALTANAYPEDVKACLDSGMNGFVAKPVRKAALLDAILRALLEAPSATPSPAAAGSATAQPLIDPEIMDELVAEVGLDCARATMETYLTDARRRIDTLRGLSVQDRQAIHFEAHTLKGSSGIFGLMHLSALAQRLERESQTIAQEAYTAAVAQMVDVSASSGEALTGYLCKAENAAAV